MQIRTVSLMLVCVSLLCAGSYAHADEASKLKGLEIATERKSRDMGWGDSSAEATMILRNASGQEASRELRMQSFEMLEDGDKALTIFDSPKDVAGTAFLSFSHAREPDEQWIYLPAIKRVKRIATKNKSGPFVGSEFAFEDMTSFEVEKYDYDLIREDTFDGEAVWVIEQTPKDDFSGYSKTLVWVDKSEYRARQIEYFDRKGAPLKILVLEDFRLYKDKYWRPHSSEMINLQTGKSTRLITNKLEFDTGVKESDFDKSKLRRAR
ncbi:outer membrane lipoprotein-sorting protein [Alteromonas sediminis]|uniref:Outer membrane lipoprotein-sorting protein n=1 Tax=Alteromonas sediminis TaxID=2259342 RepID=A0A3N5YQA5_9ALTE|nr:outer membrane lipoprotein-sorting protein [Alteromonas sediminis]RPJ68241.1 outer membrane lipoprotein-sorting protein [Alteromonas sediminis]